MLNRGTRLQSSGGGPSLVYSQQTAMATPAFYKPQTRGRSAQSLLFQYKPASRSRIKKLQENLDQLSYIDSNFSILHSVAASRVHIPQSAATTESRADRPKSQSLNCTPQAQPPAHPEPAKRNGVAVIYKQHCLQ